MANMIKFFKGSVNTLPASGVDGALYITTDEGAIYLGTGAGMKRLGDFIQVDAVANLPTDGANTSALYYCVKENVLCRYDSVKGWVQINKQPTADELKVALGLGGLAYKSEVAEGDLNAALKEKVNAAAEGNHSHNNKALLDTYTQTEADLADAVAKKHAHANADELAKIADGDKAKWDAVAADHLTSADKTTLENAIKEAKKAGTDANTALESYKVTNDAAIDAIEEDIAEIVDGTNGILAQAKAYADGKDAAIEAAKKAGDDAQDAIDAYIESNNAALAGVKATADAAAVKTEVETALAGKVDKVEGKSLIDDSEIARLATLANYDDTAIRGEIAKKADAEATTNALNGKVDKVTGFSLVSDTEIARLAEVDNYDDEAVRGLIGDNADAIEALAEVVGEVEEGKTVVEMIAEAQEAATYDDTALAGRVKTIEDDYLKAADKTELAGLVTAEKERAEGIEGGLRTDVDAIKADYLKAADKKALQDQIDLIMNNPDTEDVINSINEFTQYIADHGEIAEGFRKDIDANAKAIADQATADAATFETKDDAAAKLTEAKGYTDAEVAKDRERIAALEAIDHDAYVDADATLKAELQAEIDADVKALADGAVATNAAGVAANAEAIAANTAAITAGDEATLGAAKTYCEGLMTWGEF